MPQTASQLKTLIDAAATQTGGKWLPFDPVWYSNMYVTSINAYLAEPGHEGKTLLDHYVDVGAKQGFMTSAAFNPQFYLNQWADLRNLGLDGTDLLAHWIKFGTAEGRAASAETLNFDGARYLAQYPDVATYVNAHLSDFLGSVSNGALAHYVKFGAAEQREGYTLSGQSVSLTAFPLQAPITFTNGILDLDNNASVNILVPGPNGGYTVTHTTLTNNKGAAVVADGATTGGVLRLSGEAAVRVDFTNPNKQVTGIDLNANGTIDANGVENNIAGAGILTAKNFNVLDAYARNPLNTFDDANNYLGGISYDGTGFAGDGTKTNGNIFLGGLGADTALGGIGNDFLAGGGSKSGGSDQLGGGRNADFFFAELSLLSATDGNNVRIDGGTTADNTIANISSPAGGLGTQDNDWLLLEASDDDEPVTYDINEGSTGFGNLGNLRTASGRSASVADTESVNASGNLYGFLNNVNTVIGARAYDGYGDGYKAGAENYGRGSTAQLIINGSSANNVIIGGYDNDQISGGSGDDLLMGGDLRFLITNKNNPNLLDANGGLKLTGNSVGVVFDGRDSLSGGSGNDNIVFEMDGGSVSGDSDTGKTSGNASGTDDKPYDGPRFSTQGDMLWLTNFSTGRLSGATLDKEATASADALAKMTTDSVVRIDLGTGNAFKNYGGAATSSQDTTNYAASGLRTSVSTMESVNATGLGAIDYSAAGSNSPDLKFNNVQNYNGLNANLDLRGTSADNALLANNGNDTLEGRGGDDVLSGGAGSDKFVVQFGDGVDWIARPVDANGDNIWDTSGGLVVTGSGSSALAWGQDFRAPAAPTAGTTTLVVNFGATVIDGKDTFLATFQVNIDGKTFGAAIPASSLAAAKNTTEIASIVNANYSAADKNVSVVATSPTTIEVRVVDATPGDGKLPVIGTTPADGFFVAGTAPGAGNTFSANGSILGTSGTDLEDDRLIIKTYEDRSINLGADQTKVEISQAAQMVAAFGTAGTRVVQADSGYTYRLYLDSVREGDTISVDINGTKYEYTLKAGENAEAAAGKLATAVNTALDINAASGTITAASSTTSFGDGFDNGSDQAAVWLTQAFNNNSATYMDITATVTRADGASPFGSVSLHNQTNTMVQMLGFQGTNGGLTSQDKDSSPVILFQGRNTGTTTMSELVTAKDTGQTITGTSANQSTLAPGNWINGDDLIYGGAGNDKLIGGSGDDRFIMTGGTDTVYGDNEDGTGGSALRADGTKQTFYDVLQGEQRTFGAGTRFNVTLDGTLYKNGVGTLQALDSSSKVLATTNFNGIELVRVLENNRQSSLDLKALSDSIAVAVGNDSLAAEGLDVLLTKNPGTTYTIDKNNNGVIVASEITTATAVLGVENLTTGNANDRVTLDQTQLTANNVIDLGAQQDNTVLATLREGADIVTYDHADPLNDGSNNVSQRPTLTLQVQGASSSTLAATAGVLGKATYTDTLKNVEIVDLNSAATSTRYNDVIDLSKLAGGTVNYGTAETVGKSVGGGNSPVTTVAQLDANTLDTGGIALTGNALGTELVTVQGVVLMERVTGSAGSDRVILADATQFVGTGDFAPAPGPGPSAFDYNFGTGAMATTPATYANQGLYQFDLGAGNDVVDYKQETGAVVVSVDTATDTDLIRRDNTIDYATNVERYFGGNNANNNWIDLAASTVGTTIQFSKEANSNTVPNEYQDPAGNDGVTTTDLTRGIEVRNTADNTVYATFMDRTGAGTVTGASYWLNVFGSNQAETVLFTDNETALIHNLYLRGGANRVDYSALTTTVTATIGPVNTGVAALLQNSIVNNDLISVTRAPDPTTNHLTVIGSTRAGDQLDVTGLDSLRVVPTAGNLIANTSQVDPLFNVVDLGAGVVTESLFGQYQPGATPLAAGFRTYVTGFENASNAGNNDVVHMLGDNGRNALTGGLGNDLIYGARGTAGDGTVDVGLGNRGDLLNGNGGANIYLYRGEAESPGGVINVDQVALNFGNNPINVINSVDTLADFVAGTDKIAVEINDTYEVVRANGTVPANLAGLLNSVTNLNGVLGATTSILNFAKDVTLPGTANDVDNYRWDHPTSGALSPIDFITRVKGTGGSDIIDASLGLSVTPLNAASIDGWRVDVVYTAASQSQAGGFDQIIHFTSGSDKIDLSFLMLPRFESLHAGNGVNFDTNNNNIVDALEGNAIRALGAAPVFAVNAPAANMFIDGGIYKPIATQTLTDGAGDPSTSVFIDVNGDGNYDPNVDMVTILVGVNAPVTADFIFNQYGGGWGG